MPFKRYRNATIVSRSRRLLILSADHSYEMSNLRLAILMKCQLFLFREKKMKKNRRTPSLYDNKIYRPLYFVFSGIITNEHGEIIGRDSYCSGQPPRQKRVRTSFKHHQLRTMKSYFALNHNPDAKDLKQLSQKTQLSKRVLQVQVTGYFFLFLSSADFFFKINVFENILQ